MILSRYNFYEDCFEKSGFALIYNTKSGSVLKIDDFGLWNALKNNSINLLSKSNEQILAENGIIVESDADEFINIREKYRESVNSSSVLYLTMMPTENCNFACPYCFVYEKKSGVMNENIYEKVFSMIERVINKYKNLRTINLNWFGGEPSLCLEKVIDFSKCIKELSKSNNINLIGSMTTNGYLLTKEAFQRLLDVGINNIQITVDGTQKTHDEVRCLKDGRGTYNTIWNNIRDIATLPIEREFSLDIRCNFRRSTIDAVYTLIENYRRDFSADPRIHLYCRPVYHYDTKSNDIESIEEDIMSLKEGLDYQTRFAEKILESHESKITRRMFDPLPQPTSCWCNAEKKFHLIIGARGEVYVCDTLTGDEYVMDYVRDDLEVDGLHTVRYDIFSDKRTERCMDCKLLPICMGGCMRNRLLNNAECYWTEEGIQEALQRYANRL